MGWKPWCILLLALVGNCGLWLFCFNRINATGLRRVHTKRVEKLCMAMCGLLPAVIAFVEWPQLANWLLQSHRWFPSDAQLFNSYGLACVVSGLVLGAFWLESRLWMIPPRFLRHTYWSNYDVHRSIEGGTPGDRTTAFFQSLPGNEIGQLQVTHKQLLLPRALPGFAGLRIGHLSDLHLTGQYRQAHYHFVIDRLLELNPDLIILSGDIIDYDRCLPWIEPLLCRLQAPLGCSFVLGNHDLRVGDLNSLLAQFTELGLFDLGYSDQLIELPGDLRIELRGNEHPWLHRHPDRDERTFNSSHSQNTASGNCLRIAVSHSPDQIGWARRHNCDLMLAGHTHGGQVRFPIFGPIVAPSNYGSRFASGVFYLEPTLMHVSRGVAGTHPLRWRCKPEVSLLELLDDEDLRSS